MLAHCLIVQQVGGRSPHRSHRTIDLVSVGAAVGGVVGAWRGSRDAFRVATTEDLGGFYDCVYVSKRDGKHFCAGALGNANHAANVGQFRITDRKSSES